MNQINDVLNEAGKWVGYLEKRSNAKLESKTENAGYGNYTIFSEWYKRFWHENYQAQPWCAVFVSVILKRVNVPIKPFAYCPYGADDFKKRGQWHKATPRKGDIIFYKNAEGVAFHVGIVESVDNTYVTAIEGNTSGASGVVDNGGGVFRKKYALNYNKIMGYGRPNYIEEDEEILTYEQFKKYMERYTHEKEALAANDWAKSAWNALTDAGITDGTMPQAYMTREQYAVMEARKNK